MSLEFVFCTRFYEISAVDITLHILRKECMIMILVGIDIGKNQHTFSIIDKNTGEILSNPSCFPNNREGFLFLIKKLNTYSKSDLLIGMEDTGHYHFALLKHFLDSRYTVALINPTAAVKGQYLKSVTLTSTMGPGVKINPMKLV